jgi:arabinogalactan oligomer / maltooligosaccharide transport system permease protein
MALQNHEVIQRGGYDPMTNQRRGKFKIGLLLSYLLLIVIAICCIYPALWILLAAFRPGASLYSPTFFPKSLTLDHFTELFANKNYKFAKWYWNSMKIATFTMLFTVILTTLGGYSLSRFRFKSRKTVMSAILVLGMFPSFMSLTAIYILLLQLDLLNNVYALVMIYSAGALLGSFIVKGFFDTIPKSLEEAARIDGAVNLLIFFRIMLPLSKPMITYVAITSFSGAWVEFILSRLVLRSKDNWSVAVGLWDMVNQGQNTNFALFATGSVLIAVPITLLFIFLQNFLVDGLTAGASKG